MKSVALVSVLGLAAVSLFQACGSDDDKRKLEPEVGGAAGQRSEPGGAPVGGRADAGGEGGTPAAGHAATPGGAGGAATNEPTDGGASGAGGDGGNSGVGAEGGAGGAAAEITCERAATCANNLSGVGTEDFSIAFSIQTEATVGSGIVSQRGICMRSMFWDIRLRGGGTSISVELDDGANYTDLTAPMVLNDGAPHEVRVCRKSGHVYVFADDELVTDGANATAFETLPALATKTTTCTQLDGTITLDGTVSNVCVGAL